MLGALDLFAFCFLVIFGNVLDFRTYTNARGDPLEDVAEYDQNGIAVEERVNMCQARGVGLELLRWWNAKYTTDAPGAFLGPSEFGAFTTHMLMTQVAALLNYKRSVQIDNREGSPGCTYFMLTRQIENVVSLIVPDETPSAVLLRWRKARHTSATQDRELGFSPQTWSHITITERQPPLQYGKHYSPDTSTPPNKI